MSNDALDNLCRQKAKKGKDWAPYLFEAVEGGVLVTGAATDGTYSRGPRKGRTRWAKPARDKERVLITTAEWKRCFAKGRL